ncbi:MAG TPA: LytTR family DNA-binding domain-containing protein [Saprospiraceae bacterium]|nr:LytTR family DNA-binding domain-containing protein [Saprospiraceae bacterium]HND88319.1 LytTR family DNA-binding domain-containing protein [Saprospiraceae bacterium]
MSAVFQWFSRPYPFEEGWPHHLRLAAAGGVFIWLFLFFFKPFGTQIEPGEEFAFLLICFYFGLVTAAVFVLVGAVAALFPRYFQEEGWTVGREVLLTTFTIFLIGVGNLLLAHALMGHPLTLRHFGFWQGATFIVGTLPTSFGVFHTQLRGQRRYAAAAAALNRQAEAHHHAAAASAAPMLTLCGDNQGERLSLPAADLCYLAAADNYVQVHYLQGGLLKSMLLRSTLRRMEEQLAAYPQFFRCHRTYLVNVDQVAHVSGNAQGYRLHFDATEQTVPVSRNLNEEISKRWKG